MPEIGNLLVALQMESAQFNKGIGEATRQLDGFGRQFSRMSSAIDTHSTVISGAIGKITAAVKGMATVGGLTAFANWANTMAAAGETAVNTAAALGMSLPQFLALQGALEATGSSAEEASKVITKVSVQMGAALADPASEAARSFNALGISTDQLREKSNDVLGVMGLLADAWQKLPDGPQKTAIFTELLSARFKVLVGLFKDGKIGMDDLMQAFRDANPGFIANAVAAGQVDDSFDKLIATMKGFAGTVFTSMQAGLQDTAREFRQLGEAAGWALRQLNAVKNFLRHGPDIATADIPDAPAPGAGDKSTDYGGGGDTAKSKGGGGGGGRRRGGGGGGGGKGAAAKEARAAEKDVKDTQREAIDAAQEQERIQDELFRRREQALRHDLDMEKVTKQESIVAERKLLDEKWLMTKGFYDKKLTAAVADKDETRRLSAQQNLDYERFLTERKALEQDAALETRSKFKEVFSDIGESIKSSLGGAFDKILEGTFKLRDAIGNLLKDIGKKLASKAMDKLFDMGGNALFSGFGSLFGGGGGLTTAFAGAGRGKLDFSGTTQAFAGGGSFRVGGAGALDSQLVAFRASPGEMVDVHHGDGARGGREAITINLATDAGLISDIADQRIVTRSGQIIEVAVRQSQRTVARNFGGMSAEARQRQL